MLNEKLAPGVFACGEYWPSGVFFHSVFRSLTARSIVNRRCSLSRLTKPHRAAPICTHRPNHPTRAPTTLVCCPHAQPADLNTFELVYHLRPMRVNYLQPLPPPQYPPPPQTRAEGGEASVKPTGEALLLESLGESVRAEEIALAAGAAEEEAAAVANAAAAAGIAAAAAAAAVATDGEQEAAARNPPDELSPFDGPSTVGAAAVAAEIEIKAAERALGCAALDIEIGTRQNKDWNGMDIGYRDSEWAEREDERILGEAAAAAMAAWEIADHGEEGEGRDEDGAGEKRERWGEAEVGEWPGADEAAEMAALAVTLRQYPE